MNAYWLEAQKAELLSIQCQLESMKAANANREYLGSSPAYGEISFCILSDRALKIQLEINEAWKKGAEYK